MPIRQTASIPCKIKKGQETVLFLCPPYGQAHHESFCVAFFKKRPGTWGRAPSRARRREIFHTAFLVLFAPAVSKRTETVFSHNIKTAVGRGLAPAVQNKKEALCISNFLFYIEVILSGLFCARRRKEEHISLREIKRSIRGFAPAGARRASRPPPVRPF